LRVAGLGKPHQPAWCGIERERQKDRQAERERERERERGRERKREKGRDRVGEECLTL